MSLIVLGSHHVLAVRTTDVAAFRRGFPCCAGFAGEQPQGCI